MADRRLCVRVAVCVATGVVVGDAVAVVVGRVVGVDMWHSSKCPFWSVWIAFSRDAAAVAQPDSSTKKVFQQHRRSSA